jgi:hypothetical protein
MPPLFKLALLALIAVYAMQVLRAQDLAPRAYIITPLHSNAVTLTWSFYDGGLNFNGTIPITGATGTYNVPVFSYYHSFSFFGRSANITASLPYAVGTFSGSVLGTQRSIYRSGLLDFSARLSVNLKGGPAMPVQTFVKWKQKMLLGASLKIIAPTGQPCSQPLMYNGAGVMTGVWPVWVRRTEAANSFVNFAFGWKMFFWNHSRPSFSFNSAPDFTPCFRISLNARRPEVNSLLQ